MFKKLWDKITIFMYERKTKKSDFDKALEFTLQWEGGYVNNPSDPGGETKWGISKKSYPDLDIKNLTKESAICIYKQDYWEKAKCHKYSWPLNIVMFDAAVNCGVYKAEKFKKDAEISHDVNIYAINCVLEREKYYRNLAKKKSNLEKFLKGWLNRTRSLKLKIIKGDKNG